MDIKIEDYLTKDEIKEICADHIRSILNSGNKERIIDNIAFHSSFALLDSVLTEEMKGTIIKKVVSIINSESTYGLFRKKDAWEHEDSEAYIEVKKAVSEHKHLISGKVKEAILAKDYTKELPDTQDLIGEILIDALRKGLAASKAV